MRDRDRKLVVALTRQEALELGIVRCGCGHPPNNHFPDLPGKPCAHCACKRYQETFSRGIALEKPRFTWKREVPGMYILNQGDDKRGGYVLRLAADDWRVYGFGGGIANCSRLRVAKRFLENALLKSFREQIIP